MCVQGFMKFRPRGFKILRKQSVTDGRTDNVKTVYPPYNFVIAGGIITFDVPKNESGLTQLIKMGKSIRQIWVKQTV